MSNEYSVERRIKQHKLRRKARRGEIAIRRIYKLIRFIFILIILYGVYRILISHYWYLPNDIYTNPNSKNIEILGNRIVKKERIIGEMKKINLEKKPIYRINPAPIAHQIETLKPIKRAYVRRFWLPARLVVMIEEVTPAIIVSPTEDTPAVIAYALTGEVIPKEYLPLDESYNTVKVLSYGTQGDDYEKWNNERISTLYRLAKNIESYSKERVEYIDLRQPHNIFVQLTSVKIRLGELDVSVFERIKAISDILPEVKMLNENIKYIDLSWKESKYIKLDKKST